MRREERFEVGELARVEIDVPTGSVQARSGAAGRVEVVVDAGSAEQFEISRLGDAVTVRAPSGWFARGGRANVSLVVPVRTDVAINVATAEVNLRGELGAVRARSASADIAVDEATRVEAHSASGDVRVQAAGEVQVSSASGDIRIGSVAGALSASSASGDIGAERRDNVEAQPISALDPNRLRPCGTGLHARDEVQAELRRLRRRFDLLLGIRFGVHRRGLVAVWPRQQRGDQRRDRQQDEHDHDQSTGSHASSLGASWDSAL